MKGLELAEAYFFEFGLKMIESVDSLLSDRCAAGLAGPGSECYGFDDEISKDHDWGPAFCIWLTDDDYKLHGKELDSAYKKLPAVFMNEGPRIASKGEEHRVGVMRAGEFFKRYLGKEKPGPELKDWIIPDENFGICTNGKVFHDPSGFFTKMRNRLSENYPEALIKKRIAARLLDAGQAGQYNVARSEKRLETLAAEHEKLRFCESSLKIAFLLNREFPPYYKWLNRGAQRLPFSGPEIAALVLRALSDKTQQEFQKIVDEVCLIIIKELGRRQYSSVSSDFLIDHALYINENIKDDWLRDLPFTYF